MKILLKEMSFWVIFSLITSPHLRFDREVCDFGRIPQGKPVNAVFHFFNDGAEPLVIYSVDPACGCTTATFTRDAVGRSHSGSIVITFNAAVLHTFEKQIVVRSNSATPVRVLYIKGEVH